MFVYLSRRILARYFLGEQSFNEETTVKVLIVGGTGFIGRKVVSMLRERGHDAVAASPGTGVNTITGEGLDEAIAGAEAVLDVTNAPTFDPKGVLDFFTTSTSNLAKAERRAGVRHHVVLSIVGIEASRQPLSSWKNGPGSRDPGFGCALHDRACYPVHGIPREHRGLRHVKRRNADFDGECPTGSGR